MNDYTQLLNHLLKRKVELEILMEQSIALNKSLPLMVPKEIVEDLLESIDNLSTQLINRINSDINHINKLRPNNEFKN